MGEGPLDGRRVSGERLPSLAAPPLLVAVDLDGTLLRSDYTYDAGRLGRVLRRMECVGSRLVVASGNTHFQVERIFPGLAERLACVTDNGALVTDRGEVVYMVDIPRDAYRRALDAFAEDERIYVVVCSLEGAYCQRGAVPVDFFERTRDYAPRLEWVGDLCSLGDRPLKFSLTVPAEATVAYLTRLAERLAGDFEVTTSGYGAIDVIAPGCHKASGVRLLAERWGLAPEQCVAFGDGGNDLEMLAWCGQSYAMANAPARVRRAAARVCPSNDEDGVLVTLDRLFPAACGAAAAPTERP